MLDAQVVENRARSRFVRGCSRIVYDVADQGGCVITADVETSPGGGQGRRGGRPGLGALNGLHATRLRKLAK
jgi:hypothetical protein